MQYLKIWCNFQEIIEPLSDAETGRLLKMMLHYAETGETPSQFEGNERFVWAIAKQNIDYTETKAETLRQNGLKGGRPRNQNEAEESKEKQKEANESKEKQTEANESHKDKDKDKDNIIKENVKEKSPGRFTPPTLEQVTEYCRERNKGVNPEKWFNYYSSNGWKVGKNPMKDWKAAVRTWENNDSSYQASTPAKVTPLPAQNYSQRSYADGKTEDEKAMEAMARLQAMFGEGVSG